jgi:hypothetical protein
MGLAVLTLAVERLANQAMHPPRPSGHNPVCSGCNRMVANERTIEHNASTRIGLSLIYLLVIPVSVPAVLSAYSVVVRDVSGTRTSHPETPQRPELQPNQDLRRRRRWSRQLPVQRKEHLADLSAVLRRSQPGTLAAPRVAHPRRSLRVVGPGRRHRHDEVVSPGVSGRFAAPRGDHRCEHEVEVAVREVRQMRLDLLGRSQFRGQELLADVPDRGRLQDRARA